MSARVFLDLLLKEYRADSLYTIANMLNWALDALIAGDPLEALASIARSEVILLGEMQRWPVTVNWYTRDLALLHAVKKMIEQEKE
jgi:hypothetical protein